MLLKYTTISIIYAQHLNNNSNSKIESLQSSNKETTATLVNCV